MQPNRIFIGARWSLARSLPEGNAWGSPGGSDKTTLTEYYDPFQDPNGDNWFTVTTIVTDPVYLYTPFVTTTDFKKEADGRKFNPTPCGALEMKEDRNVNGARNGLGGAAS